MKKKFLTFAIGAIIASQMARAEDEPRREREANADREVRREDSRPGERERDRAPDERRVRGDRDRVIVFAERVIVRLLHLPIAEREIVNLEFGLLPEKVSAVVLLSFAEVARVIVQFKVVRLSLAKLMVVVNPNVFFLNKVAKGGLPHLSEYGRNSSVATRWSVRSARNFGARSSLTPNSETACSCSSNVSRGWSLADLFSELFGKSSRAIAKNGLCCQAVLIKD